MCARIAQTVDKPARVGSERGLADPCFAPLPARPRGPPAATCAQLAQPLLDEGVLEELEPLASGVQGGKPARPLWFSDDGGPVGAVVVLPQGVKAAAVAPRAGA